MRRETSSGSVPVILVHGGAGANPHEGPDELRDGIRAAVVAGWRVLMGGGRSLDAVEAAVRVLEDAPRFNTGLGSVLTSLGTVETDAAVMEGAELSGEAIIRTVLAHRALDLLAKSDDPDSAAHVAVDVLTGKGRGEGGLILVDPRGRIGYAQSTAFMPVGWMSAACPGPQVPF